jgi:PBP1b-binding outer membrane lipoprotein LpoB
MKAKILLLMIFSGLILGGCRSKQKITTVSRENIRETETVKVDSLNLQNSETIQSELKDLAVKEKINEISGDFSITGKSDLSSPFVFHNVVGKDTVQSISIMGNAEYSIRNHYAKASNEKTENIKEAFSNISREANKNSVFKETEKEKASVVSQETKRIKVTGFGIAAWIFITVFGITVILLFFTYKYFKK